MKLTSKIAWRECELGPCGPKKFQLQSFVQPSQIYLHQIIKELVQSLEMLDALPIRNQGMSYGLLI